MYVYVYVHVSIYICRYMHMYMYVYMCICICICIRIRIYLYLYVYVYVCMHETPYNDTFSMSISTQNSNVKCFHRLGMLRLSSKGRMNCRRSINSGERLMCHPGHQQPSITVFNVINFVWSINIYKPSHSFPLLPGKS